MQKIKWALICLVLLFLLCSCNALHGPRLPQEKERGAYLLTYFKDDTHSLHMALSTDGYTFTAVNDGKPVVAGDEIASQKGIRDPHITRGPDGAFYVAMTDLHIFGQQAGYRTTPWERPAEQYDWGNNRGFVLSKSFDLIQTRSRDTTHEKGSNDPGRPLGIETRIVKGIEK